MSFSPEKFTTLRARTGLTQVEFAEKTGLTHASISHYECGRRSPSVRVARRLLDTFKDYGVRKPSGGAYTLDDLYPG